MCVLCAHTHTQGYMNVAQLSLKVPVVHKELCVMRVVWRGCVQNNCLVDPASSICLFQRLSHACLSTVVFTRRYRGRLIKSVVVQMGPSSRYTWITVVIPELIHATHIPRCLQKHRRKHLLDQCPTAWCALCARTAAARINGDSG